MRSGSVGLSVELAALLRREAFLRRTAGPGHGRSALLDELARVGVAVLVGLRPTARVVGPSRTFVVRT